VGRSSRLHARLGRSVSGPHPPRRHLVDELEQHLDERQNLSDAVLVDQFDLEPLQTRHRAERTRRGRRGARPALPSARKLRINVDEKARRGGWRVHGRYSIGASRGTDWITEEKCEGTVTTVISGTVRVRDLGRRKTVSVRAGERYVARH
jgi:hypothetical protein